MRRSARLAPVGSVRERLGLPNATPYPHWLVDKTQERNEGRWASSAVYLAWELSRSMKSGTSPEDGEAFQALLTAVLLDLDEGSTRLRVSSLPVRLRFLGASEELARRARSILEPASPAAALVGRPTELKPLILDGDYLYLQRVHQQECRLVTHVRARLNAKAERSDFEDILDALDAVLAHRPVVHGVPIRLSTEQQQAVRTALTRPLTLVSGGPGTGKTAIVAAILRVLARLGVSMEEVSLAAPTARAVRRLRASLQDHLQAIPEPDAQDRALIDSFPRLSILHRSQSGAIGRFGKFVILGEAEGVDLESMEWLFRSLGSDAKLVLLGDVDQLSSVESGGIFREMLHRSGSAVQLLEDRTTRNILDVVRAVSGGKPEALFRPGGPGAIAVRERAADLRFEGVELLESDRDGFAERWYEEHVRIPGPLALEAERIRPPVAEDARATLQALVAHFHRHRVLGTTRRDVFWWNERLDRSELCRPVIASCDGEPGIELGSSLFFAQGVSRDVALAYAETVRVSQGSELDRIAVVLPEPNHPLLFRQFLTTALTQAIESVTLLGSQDAVVAAVERVAKRSTGIGARLEGR